MKITCWKATRLLGLSGLVAVCGCVTPKAAPQTAGLTSQQLVNVAEKPQPSSWLPKLPLPSPGKTAAKSSRGTLADDPPAREAAGKGKSQEPADLMSLARLNERRGQRDLARQMYLKELEKNPNNARAHHRLAVMAAQEEQWDESNKHFTIAEQLLPNNSELLCDMGYALYLQHRLEPAESYLRKAIEVSPRNQSAHNNLGIVLGVQGKFEESFAEFRRVGTEAEAHTNLAYVYAQLGDIDRAMASLNRALALDSNLRVAAVALLQLNEVKKHLAPDEETAKLLANHDPISDPSPSGSPNKVFQRQTAAAQQPEQSPAAEDVASRKPSEAERPVAVAKAAPADNEAASVARRSTQASDLVEQVVDGPAKTPAASRTRAAQAVPAATASAEPSHTVSATPSATPASETDNKYKQFAPWLAAPRQPLASASRAAAAPPPSAAQHNAPPAAGAQPKQVVAVPLDKGATSPAAGSPGPSPLAASSTSDAAAAQPNATQPLVVENRHVTAAKPVTEDPAPAGKPPRTVAARPLPGKSSVAATKPLTPAPTPDTLANSHSSPGVFQAAEPRRGDSSHNVAAMSIATTPSPRVTPASANLGAAGPSVSATTIPTVSASGRSADPRTGSKSALQPAPSAPALAPIVTPTERMQQIQSRQRSAAQAAQAPAAVAARPIETKKPPKDGALLSMLPSADVGGGAMMPKPPQAAEDSTSALISTRQASVPIPRTEDLMPADAMIHQAPMSALHPTAQSTWSSSSQPLRYLTDQAGMSAARAAEQAAAEGRNSSQNASNPTPRSSNQPPAGPLPKSY